MLKKIVLTLHIILLVTMVTGGLLSPLSILSTPAALERSLAGQPGEWVSVQAAENITWTIPPLFGEFLQAVWMNGSMNCSRVHIDVSGRLVWSG